MTQENAVESIGTDLKNGTMPLAPELVIMMEEEIRNVKNQKLPVNRAFEVIAKKSGLKFNTVRNYYYRYIHEKGKKNRGTNDFGNSVNRNKRNQGVAGNSFEESEVRNLIMYILKGQAEGKSVRSCANHLANNNPKLMLRYQNKYRNVIANRQEYVRMLMEEMNRKGIKYYDPYRKICVNPVNAEYDGDDDLLKGDQKEKTNFKNYDSSANELLETIGQLTANMREIDGQSLGYFFKGLRDLSQMAVQWKNHEEQLDESKNNSSNLKIETNRYNEMLKEKDCEIQELNARILSYETRMEDYRKKVTRLMSMFHQLMSINRNFLNLSSAGKLTGLQDYTKELEKLIKDYDKEIAD